jgi:ATPase subunit of ABC transporter with duplicated ATPase domains
MSPAIGSATPSRKRSGEGSVPPVWLRSLMATQRLSTLSGGQVVSLGIVGQLLKRPDVLLLDEPTNNLDMEGRHRLYDVLEEWRGCLLVVSHDRALLDRMDRIAELDRGEMRRYGATSRRTRSPVRIAQEAAERGVRTAEQELKREKREMQLARERAERRAPSAGSATPRGTSGMPAYRRSSPGT